MSNEQLDTAVNELTRAATKAIEESTPWHRESERSKEYWFQECREAVSDTRRKYYSLQREYTTEAEDLHREARRKKVKTIPKHKIVSFRNKIEEVAKNAEGAWRLALWARKKVGTLKEPPQLPQLVVKKGNEKIVASSLNEKVEASCEKFFPPP